MTNNNLQKTLCNGMMYGLKFKSRLLDEPQAITGINIDHKVNLIDVYSGSEDFHGEAIKPYLFDLTDLTKEIEFRGQRFVPLERLFIPEDHDMQIRFIRNDRILEFYTHYTGSEEYENHYELYLDEWWGWEFWIIDKLTEWHFNVFELSKDQFIRVTEELNPYK